MKYKGIKKLYYSISEISELLGVKQSVIRYWESEFKELKPQKNRAGNRIYKKDDIAILRLIHHYVYERHLSIHEANEVITDLKNDGLYKRKLQEVNSVELKPAPVVEEDSEVDEVEEVEEVDEVDEVEEVDKVEEEKVEEKPKFEIVTPTQETFIYPLDEQKPESTSAEATVDKEVVDIPEKEDIPEAKPEPVAKPIQEPETIEEVKPEPVIEPEPVKQSDPELKELLKKISGNIKDIIDILNE